MFVFKLGGFRLNKVGFSPWQSRLFILAKSAFHLNKVGFLVPELGDFRRQR